jgi:2-keto-3-deoxy-6-phosphogluconate aldolase
VLKDQLNISVKIAESLELKFNNKEEIAQIAKALINKGIDVYELYVINTDLEQIFLDITNN